MVMMDHRFGAGPFSDLPPGPLILAGVRRRPSSSDFILDFLGVPIARHCAQAHLQGEEPWTTRGVPLPPGAAWSHLDLACGIGGFTVAAHRLGGACVRACDISPVAVAAFNAAHAAGRTPLAHKQAIEDRSWWSLCQGVDVVTAGFPCQPFSRVGGLGGFDDARGNVFFSLAQLCAVLVPRFLVPECVLIFSSTIFGLGRRAGPSPLSVTLLIREEQASGYRCQVRRRGLFIIVRGDLWRVATGGRLSALLDGKPPRRVATPRTTGIIRPDPPLGDPLDLSEHQRVCYAVHGYDRRSWPSRSYRRTLHMDGQSTTIMNSYGVAENYYGSRAGVHTGPCGSRPWGTGSSAPARPLAFRGSPGICSSQRAGTPPGPSWGMLSRCPWPLWGLRFLRFCLLGLRTLSGGSLRPSSACAWTAMADGQGLSYPCGRRALQVVRWRPPRCRFGSSRPLKRKPGNCYASCPLCVTASWAGSLGALSPNLMRRSACEGGMVLAPIQGPVVKAGGPRFPGPQRS